MNSKARLRSGVAVETATFGSSTTNLDDDAEPIGSLELGVTLR
jgi:hypothetical protein